jgi:hypothetical protein
MARVRLVVAYSNKATLVTTRMEYLSRLKISLAFDVGYLHVTDTLEARPQ